MGKLIGTRFLAAVPTLFLVSIAVFGLVHLLPGDPAATMLGDRATPERIAAVRERLGLDRALVDQYLSWVGGVLHGDLGVSLSSRQPVTDSVLDRLPVTLSLTLAGLLVSVAVGLPAGTLAAIRPRSALDRTVSAATAVAVAVPAFWLAVMAAYVFSIKLGWFPATGYTPLTENPVGWLHRITLPTLTLSLVGVAVVARQTRTALVDVFQQDYIRVLQAKGLPPGTVVVKHALKNAFVPILTTLGILVLTLLGTTVFVEQVFGLPGLGQYLIVAVGNRDLPVIQGVVLVTAVAAVITNLVVDVAYGWFNPRARVS